VEHITFEDLDVRIARDAVAQLSSQYAVELDSDQSPGAGCQHVCQNALAWPDLQNDALSDVAKGVHDLFGCTAVAQKVLAEPGLGRGSQIDHFSFCHLDFLQARAFADAAD